MNLVLAAILVSVVLFVIVIGSLIFYFLQKDKTESEKQSFAYGTDGDDESDDFINQLKNGL